MLNFRNYQFSLDFYRLSQNLCLPRHLRHQLNRAASSISLNLAGGYGRGGRTSQIRFISSDWTLSECQAIIDLAQNMEVLTVLAAHTCMPTKNRR